MTMMTPYLWCHWAGRVKERKFAEQRLAHAKLELHTNRQQRPCNVCLSDSQCTFGTCVNAVGQTDIAFGKSTSANVSTTEQSCIIVINLTATYTTSNI